MPTNGRMPDEPLTFIMDCVRRRQVLWTYHVNMRLGERAISRDAVLGAVDGYEIIESNVGDRVLPSYLVYAPVKNGIIHIVFAVDVPGENVRVVTAYWPDPKLWDAELKSRRPK